MNPFEMVLGIVLIVTIGRVVSAKYGYRRRRRGGEEVAEFRADPDADRLRDEVRQLKDRIAVLERIATDGDGRRGLELERQIEALRDRTQG